MESRSTETFATRFGEMMNITGLPETYEGYEQLLDDFEPAAVP